MSCDRLTHLDDATLLRSLSTLVARECATTAEILAHIAEVDARRLYLEAAYPSMFAYCVGELGFSEDAAYKRIQAARAARRFPRLFEDVAAGRLHLTAVGLLAPHLAADNVDELVAAAAGRTKTELEGWIAERFRGRRRAGRAPGADDRDPAVVVATAAVPVDELALAQVDALPGCRTCAGASLPAPPPTRPNLRRRKFRRLPRPRATSSRSRSARRRAPRCAARRTCSRTPCPRATWRPCSTARSTRSWRGSRSARGARARHAPAGPPRPPGPQQAAPRGRTIPAARPPRGLGARRRPLHVHEPGRPPLRCAREGSSSITSWRSRAGGDATVEGLRLRCRGAQPVRGRAGVRGGVHAAEAGVSPRRAAAREPPLAPPRALRDIQRMQSTPSPEVRMARKHTPRPYARLTQPLVRDNGVLRPATLGRGARPRGRGVPAQPRRRAGRRARHLQLLEVHQRGELPGAEAGARGVRHEQHRQLQPNLTRS